MSDSRLDTFMLAEVDARTALVRLTWPSERAGLPEALGVLLAPLIKRTEELSYEPAGSVMSPPGMTLRAGRNLGS